jgi:hypothetical protein
MSIVGKSFQRPAPAGKIRNPKEIRSSKSETGSRAVGARYFFERCAKKEDFRFPSGGWFELLISDFFRISAFDLRIYPLQRTHNEHRRTKVAG